MPSLLPLPLAPPGHATRTLSLRRRTITGRVMLVDPDDSADPKSVVLRSNIGPSVAKPLAVRRRPR